MPPQYSYAANGSVRCYNCTRRFTPTYVAAATASFRCPYCQFSYGLSQPYPGLGYFPTIPHTPPPPTTPSQSPTSWLDEMFEEEDHDDYDDFNTLVNRFFSETNQYESRPTAASESFIYYLKAHEQTVSGTILPELINVGPCAICSDEYKLSEVVNKLPCRHWFHTDCIIPWLIRKNNCPLCRHEFSDTEHSLPL